MLPTSFRLALVAGLIAWAASPALATLPSLHLVASSRHHKAPTGAPIDGGASLLAAGGAAYLLRQIRRRQGRA